MKKLFLAIVVLVLGAGAFKIYAEGDYPDRIYEDTEEYRESYRGGRHRNQNENRFSNEERRIQNALEDGRISKEEANNWENELEDRDADREENDFAPRGHHHESRNRFGHHRSNRRQNNNRRNLGHCGY